MRPGSAFLGYPRVDGRVGVRNHVLVVPTVICAAVVAERVAAAIAPIGAALPHLAGCGQLGPDMRVTHETLAAYCAHPNVGAVLVVALGCEQVVAQTLAESARRHGKPAEIIALTLGDGKDDPGVAMAAAAPAGALSAPRPKIDTTPAELAMGRDAFARTCALCHGPTGAGITNYVTNIYNGFQGIEARENPGTFDWTVPGGVQRGWVRLWGGGGPGVEWSASGSGSGESPDES